MPSSKLRTCSNGLVLRDAILVSILNDVIEPESHIPQSMELILTLKQCAISLNWKYLWELNAAMTSMKFWLYDIFQNPYKYCVSQNQAVWASPELARWHSTPKTAQNPNSSTVQYLYNFVSITNSVWISLANLAYFQANPLRIGRAVGNSLTMSQTGFFLAAPSVLLLAVIAGSNPFLADLSS